MSEGGHPRPRVVLSRCLELAACRYDGGGIESAAVRRLSAWVEWVPVCPEVRIGLGVPRAPIRIERSSSGGQRLVQPSTGLELTERMLGFAGSFADETESVDGVLLKSRSPSCGLGDVKIYGGAEAEEPETAAGTGLFAAVLRERYPGVAMTDEVRAEDPEAWHHWLTRVFAGARLRGALARGPAGLLEHHTRYKLVLMAHAPGAQRALGRLVAEAGSTPDFDELAARYRAGFEGALAEPASRGGHMNALQHAQGYFGDLEASEKRRFEALLAEYRAGRVPLQAPLAVVAEWADRFDEPYLREQLYFRPYPAALAG